MQIVKTDRDGDVIYVLVSIHADRESAKQALNDLEEKTGSKPWIRSVSSLQNMAVQ
jgi:septal ring-binding cell division protein DamX